MPFCFPTNSIKPLKKKPPLCTVECENVLIQLSFVSASELGCCVPPPRNEEVCRLYAHVSKCRSAAPLSRNHGDDCKFIRICGTEVIATVIVTIGAF